ncbi:DEAD/DEAH box helicase family protein [Paenisporosarcina sp.]|uniref:DEAD/DEAH box helicase family protein n=1 Tax=Paenisporosarcina sp. TaxID=1932001 RepID=UPI003C74716B
MLVKKTIQTKITIVDSIMGSGKTSWAIKYMNEAPPFKKFIYITPFNTEVERVLTSVNRDFKQPEVNSGGETKLEDIKRLIADGENIVSTHALFKRLDREVIELLEMENYILILDEVMNVIEQEKITNDDLKMLIQNKVIEVNREGKVTWKKKDYQRGFFEDIRNTANSGNLMMYEDGDNNPVAIYWTFPVESFKCFEEIYILTYMFNGQIQRAYFDLFGLKYDYKSVVRTNGEYHLSSYIPYNKENRSHIKTLITIYYHSPKDKKDMNKIGSKHSAFSVADLRKRCKNKEIKRVIQNSAYNFYRNKCIVSTEEVMWTTFKEFRDKVTPRGLKNHFVSVNARATNDYQHKSTCIYLANIYTNPVIKNFFNKHHVEVDMDLFAISELLQWLFRSRIRNNQPINVFIPSTRMRKLLEQYLDNEI